ncbi:MAG: nucleoside-diphosphate sugar epimerase/dehydratase [Armatimonadota bacterium]|nr:nucleoside-diphosphate sugar epimerase/dehydratase [Armatimonadota bacterium]
MSRFIVRPTPQLRAAIFLAGDLVVWTTTLIAAFLIRFDGAIPPRYVADIPYLFLVFIPLKLLWHWTFRAYSMAWRTVGLSELIRLFKASGASTLTIAAAVFLLRAFDQFDSFPRSVLIIDFALSFGGVCLIRVGRRIFQMYSDAFRSRTSETARRLLVVGAGAAGSRLMHAMLESPQNGYQPVGFIDDDPAKRGTYIHGLRVLGDRTMIPDIVKRLNVEEVLIAIPSAPSRDIRDIVAWVRRAGVQRMRILPGVHELLSGRASLKDIRQVQIADLLGRPPVAIATDAIAERLAGSRVLVTGGAGSIGSELVRQIARLAKCEIVALDVNESGLFELDEEIRRHFPGASLRTLVADIRDGAKMDWVMSSVLPRTVYHAAAYKHVPMMERDVDEAVKTNVLGTMVLAERAVRHGVEEFVLISTDKAVKPSSVMGASKRVAEMVTHMLSHRGRTRFLSVRFGNVLGSRGSLIPIIQEQIRNGGPVTLTHPDMTRFFMSPAEAVLLVLQASLSQKPYGLYILDMGEPVRIADLAAEVIRLSGLEPDIDIPIVYTGIRPGEKLREELATPTESMVPSEYPGIFEVTDEREPDEVMLRLALQQLEHLVAQRDEAGIRTILRRLANDDAGLLALPPERDPWRSSQGDPASGESKIL